mgnify:CR=1 FL=1
MVSFPNSHLTVRKKFQKKPQAENLSIELSLLDMRQWQYNLTTIMIREHVYHLLSSQFTITLDPNSSFSIGVMVIFVDKAGFCEVFLWILPFLHSHSTILSIFRPRLFHFISIIFIISSPVKKRVAATQC